MICHYVTLTFFWIFSVNYSSFKFGLMRLKGHSQRCDCADLDTSFSHFEKSLPQPENKIHLEIRFIFPSILLDFQSFTEKPVFECPFARPMILVLSHLVKNSIYRVLSLCKLAMEWYVMPMCTSWLCPINIPKNELVIPVSQCVNPVN